MDPGFFAPLAASRAAIPTLVQDRASDPSLQGGKDRFWVDRFFTLLSTHDLGSSGCSSGQMTPIGAQKGPTPGA